jgi:hypothetical protein
MWPGEGLTLRVKAENGLGETASRMRENILGGKAGNIEPHPVG